jgi:hypothetical protein
VRVGLISRLSGRKPLVGIVPMLALGWLVGSPGRVTANASTAGVSPTMAVVTNTSDVVNGNVSSIAALNARPGRDGISLREALEAADHTRGSATLYIMFSRTLNGKRIEIRSELPPICRNHLVVEGIAPSGARAIVTLDGRRSTPFTLLLIEASDVAVRWLHFTGVNPKGWAAAMLVRPGLENGPGSSLGPKTLTNIQIEDDVFDNSGFDFPPDNGPSGIVVAAALTNPINTSPGSNANTNISGVRIAGDTFLNYTGSDALLVAADGSGATVDGVVIEHNTFAGDEYSVELATAGAGPRQSGTQIIANTITGTSDSAIGVSLNTTNSANGVIDGTLIEGNLLSGFQGAAINLRAAGEVASYGGVTPSADLVSNTQILNNVIPASTSGDAGIYVDGGDITTVPTSSVSGVAIENDTLVNDGSGSLLELIPNGSGATGNQITGVVVRNTILWDPNGMPISEGSQPYNQAPDAVANSLISGPGWAGSNGNLNVDPDFADVSDDDFQPTAGSPVVNAGTTVGAPAADFDGALRDSHPDIGAYEYGAAPRPLLTITIEPLGGNGTVTSRPAGISCGTTCATQFATDSAVTLNARPASGSRFVGWSGACKGTHSCTVTLATTETVTARFVPR